MANNSDPAGCPCYKVIGKSGELIGYSGKGGLKTILKLLKQREKLMKKLPIN